MVRKRCGEIVGLQFIQPLVRCYLFGGKCLLKKERLLETLFGKNNDYRPLKLKGGSLSANQKMSMLLTGFLTTLDLPSSGPSGPKPHPRTASEALWLLPSVGPAASRQSTLWPRGCKAQQSAKALSSSTFYFVSNLFSNGARIRLTFSVIGLKCIDLSSPTSIQPCTPPIPGTSKLSFGLASGDIGSGTMKNSSSSEEMSLMGAVRCKANYSCPKMSSNDHNPLNKQYIELFYLEFHAFPLQP